MPQQLPISVLVDTRRHGMHAGGRPAEAAILRECFALSSTRPRVPARLRLEQALGHELTSRLLTTLTMGGRR